MRKSYLLLPILLAMSNAFAGNTGLSYLTVGGGYPLGLVNSLNSGFQNAYNATNSTYGSTGGVTQSLTQTYTAGSFALNIGIGNTQFDSITANAFRWFMMLGYSYHGTGKAQWNESFVNSGNTYTLNVSGSYSMNDIRLLPVFCWPYDVNNNPRFFGLGAGGVYSFVNYSQSMSNNVPNSLQVPMSSVSSVNSGLTWIVYGFWEFAKGFGIEASSSGTCPIYFGLFIGGVFGTPY